MHERNIGVILGREKSRAVKGYVTISEADLLVRLRGKPIDFNIVQAYASAADRAEIFTKTLILEWFNAKTVKQQLY